MLKAEKYKKEISECIYGYDSARFSISKDCAPQIKYCDATNCNDCMLSEQEGYCSLKRMKWLLSEYKEPIKLSRLEYEILKLSEKEGYKYIARDEDGELCTFQSEPKKLNIAWGCCDAYIELPLFKKLFQFIQWEDEEPTSIKEVLENCKVVDDD